MESYREKFQEIQEKVSRKKHLQELIDDLYSQKRELTDRKQKLFHALQMEQEDVERLTGVSVTSIFYKLMGQMDEKLDKEKAEALAAAAKYDAVAAELAAVEEDIESRKDELFALSGCEEQYEALLREKAGIIRESGTKDGEKLLELDEEIGAVKNSLKEIGEALAAGRTALRTTEGILSSLDSAEGWGTWDILGGGLLSDIAKHGHLDTAQKKVEQLQVDLRRYKTEIQDVAVQADMNVRIDGFLQFADFFFDGLFADWAVLDKIKNSKNQVQGTKRRIEEVQYRLKMLRSSAENELRKKQEEKDEFVIRAGE